jgi:rubrerythrin
MFIKEILSQHRRDFQATYECEHCGYTEKRSGYDEDSFHRAVVPAMQCPSCDKTANSETFRPMGTKYSAHEVV